MVLSPVAIHKEGYGQFVLIALRNRCVIIGIRSVLLKFEIDILGQITHKIFFYLTPLESFNWSIAV